MTLEAQIRSPPDSLREKLVGPEVTAFGLREDQVEILN
jgi:hypothetical protein